ncbi:DUF2161 family putative PD-(D/E)XK-type phosphodiesterase [Pseudotabrizicola sp. L79]|uniref:DUF2161 family putative PD-(D/E)XK-type phosphodiesterase n=1 Tax=Pseudotabrizicola sp. L79 TaxID=3118402 RepID=UPI002F93B389
MKEADLYPPVKAFLEQQGYEVKAEIGAADVMAIRGDEPPLIVELKTALNLTLILQGVARQSLFQDVYLAVPQPPKWTHRYRDLTALLRRLGLGLLTVKAGAVEAHLDPAPYQPRPNSARAGRMLREFQRRVGDPNTGGTTGVKRMTAYRQDALRLAAHLATQGPTSPAACAAATGVARAAAILRADHYGWFDHPARGLYALSPAGQQALTAAPAA